MAWPRGGHACDRAADPADEVDHVDRLVHEHAAVQVACAAPRGAVVVRLGSLVEALGDDQRDPPEGSGLHGIVERPDRRLEPTLRDRGDHESSFTAFAHDGVGVGDGQCDRLLDDHVAPRPKCGERLFRVQAGGRRDRDRVKIVAPEQVLQAG
jgi:hypothetical protein